MASLAAAPAARYAHRILSGACSRPLQVSCPLVSVSPLRLDGGSHRSAHLAPCVGSHASPAAPRLPSGASQARCRARWGGPLFQDQRFVARIRINRFTGLKAQKIGVKKTEWQIAAEKEFLAYRQKGIDHNALLYGLTEDDVKGLTPQMRQLLTLRNGTTEDISKWRKQQHIRKFQDRPFGSNSPACRVACLTEKILRLREHMLRHPKHGLGKIMMNIYIAKRQKTMKRLYKTDFVLYRHVCKELGLRCIRFAIPNPFDNQRNINPQAVDGDQAKFVIRQRMYRRHNRPRHLRDPDKGRIIRFTRHPAERVPESHGQAPKTPQQVSIAFPYGVKEDRVQGKQVLWNPTAPGRGYWPASHRVIGGPTPK